MAIQVAAFIGIDKSIAGVAGGIVESFREIGGALGMAIIATVVLARSQDLLDGGGADVEARSLAFTEGLQRGAIVAAALSVVAAAVAGTFLRRAERPSPDCG